jgi:uncharacterized repeat protein (TIGR01451 family)
MRKLSTTRANRAGGHRNRKLNRAIPCYFETLEGRQLLSLLGVSPGYPQIFFDTTGKINYTYNAATQQGDFIATATPHLITFAQGGSSYSFTSGALPASFTINFLVNSTGGVITPQSGPNLIVDGELNDPNTGQTDNGILLQGTISQFGFEYTGIGTNFFDFRFATYAANPGLLASYFSGDDIGVTMLSQGNSFKGSFTTNWTGGANNGAGADGTLGPIPELPPALGSLAGYVYEDTDDNGVFTGTDTPLDNAEVILTGTDYLGNPVDLTAYTGSNGAYMFSNLKPSGSAGYTITEVTSTVPAYLLQGIDSVGSLGGSNSPADAISAIPLTAGMNGVRYDFGWVPPSSISGYVYFDANDDGTQDDGEPGIGGATVTITGTNDLGQFVDESTTTLTSPDNSGDQIGYYQFTGLRPSPTGYTVTETTPTGYNDGTDNVGSGWSFISQSQDQFVVTPPAILPVLGAVGTQYNFGNVLGSISGTVWFDANDNGVQDNGEPDVSGATVQLIENSAVIATETTNSSGYFDFTGLLAGTYEVQVTPPNGEAFTIQTAYQNGGSTVNSVVNPANGLSPAIALAAGQNDTNVDAGLILGSISGTVWFDTNDNGVQDTGEPDLSGVTVQLLQNSSVIATQLTNTNGYFDFTSLPAGTYQVQVIAPSGEAFTIQTAYQNGGSTINSVVTAAGLSPAIALAAGQNDTNVDAGLILGSISGTVWFDTNANGVQDAGEPDLSGVTVQLLQNSSVIAMQLTNTNGYFDFTSLPAGTYQVQVIAPSGEAFTIQTAYQNGGSTINSVVTAAGLSPAIALAAGQNDTNVDAGLILGSISGTVWFDTNDNGVQDAGEPDLSGVTVQLLQNSSVIATQLTNTNGYFDFTSLPAGTYQVQVIAPTGEAFTIQTAYQNGGSTINSVVTAAGLSPAIALAAGQNDTNVDAGLILGSISGTVWFDTNDNGVQDAGEPDLSGVTVQLLQNSSVIATQLTNTNGYFDFTSLPAGTYQVQVIAPTGEAFTIQTAYQNGGSTINSVVTAAGLSPAIALAAGQNDTNVDAGLILGSISGTVWFDTNDNGVQDTGEPDLSGVTVQLLQNSSVIATQLTNTNGYFDFTSLPAGTYQVQVIAPTGEAFTIQTAYQNGGSTINSVVTAAGLSPAIALAAGQNDTNVDAGLILGSISGTVWFDTNDNGVQDNGEPDLSGVTVQLLQNSSVIATQLTNTNGYFDFTSLPAGTYQVQVIAPTGEAFTIQTAYQNGGSTINSVVTAAGLSPAIALAAGQNDTNVDAGLILGSISGTVWFDTNDNGVQDAGEPDLSGVTVQLLQNSSVIATQLTNTNGYFDFTSLPAGTYQVQVIAPTGEAFTIQTAYQNGGSTVNSVVNPANGLSPAIALAAGQNDTNVDAGLILGSISGTVWFDTNDNGVQDNGEPDLSGVTVQLLQNSSVIATQLTNTNGYFDFTSLPAGTYQVQVIAPSGEAFTIQTAYQNGGSTINSVVTAAGLSPAIALAAGQNDTNVDAGLILGSISGTVWFDTNDNGVQDAGEPDLSGVTVQLLQNSSVIATQLTNTNGYFDFTSLPAGTYQVQVIAPTGEAFTIQTAYQNGGSTINSVVTAAGLSPAIALAAGQNDTNVDAGLLPVDLSVTKTVNNSTPNVGSNITYTLTVSNAAGYSAAGNVQLSDLLPGSEIFVSATPSQGSYNSATGLWSVGTIAAGGSATLTITAVVTGGSFPSVVNTATVSSPGQTDVGTNLTASATVYPEEVDLNVLKTVNNPTPQVGQNVTYTVTVTNGAGYSTATDVVLTDLLPTGMALVSFTPSQGTYNPTTGIWCIGTLASGGQATLVTTATATQAAFPLVVNTATVTAVDQPEVNPSFTSVLQSSATVNPQEIDLSVTKTVNNSTPNVGANVTYTVTVSNATGYDTATAVTLTDMLPAGETYLAGSASASEGSYNPVTGLWTIGNLLAGGSATLTYTATVNVYAAQTNTATININGQTDIGTPLSATVTVNPQEIDLSVAKSASSSIINNGANDTFTVVVTNAGGYSTATNISLTDALPTGETIIGTPTTSTGTFTGGTWTIPTLNSGSVATLTYVASVTGTFPSNSAPALTDTATITKASQPDIGTTLSASATVNPQEIDLSVTKSASSSIINNGANDTFTVVVTNAGGYSTATNISLTDALPTGETIIGTPTTSIGTFTGGTWTIPTLNSGSVATLTYVASVTGTFPSSSAPALTDTATITKASQPDVGTTLSASATVNPQEIDLSVTKSASSSVVTNGANDTFTVVVTNAGGYSTATNISLTDALPTGETIIGTPTTSTGTFTGGTWTIPTLNSGSVATLTYVASVTGTFPSSTAPALTDTATITKASQPDIGTTLSASATVNPQEIDLSVTKTVNNATAMSGSNVIYTVTVQNQAGYSTATDVVLKDLLPSGETFVCATPSQGTYTASTGIWSIGTLAAGSTATLTYTATINCTSPVTNTATITAADQLDIGSPLSASVTVNPQYDSISGTVYNDITGNGLTSDDTPLAGVVVNLYKDVSGTGVLTSADGAPIATVTVGANGFYSFTDLPFGKYIVTETVPTGDTETAPNPPGYYPVTVSNGTVLTNLNFDNYHACTTVLQNVCFSIQGCGTTYTDLRGNTAQGETVTATFTVPAGSAPMLYSLVSYNAPSAIWDPTVAYEQTIYQDSSGTFGPGTHTLTVTIPNNYYQIDFVCGAAINQFGPDGSNITYSAEGRLISADNEGMNSDVQGQSAAMSFWANSSTGQALIKAFGGSASSTALGTWLVTTLPNVFGGAALGNKTNTTIASTYLSYYNASGQKNLAQLMATALNIYASTQSLGGTTATAYGFSVTAAGLGAAQFDIGSNGAAFGVANGTTITVTQMLSEANSLSSNNSLYKASTSLLNSAYNEFGQVNADGGLS